MSISFKHVGTKQYERRALQTTERTTVVPYGIRMPVQLGTQGEGLFQMNLTIADEIRDNLRNLLLTNHGERLTRFTYGANLQPLCTEYVSKKAFEEEAAIRIKTAVDEWLQFIELEDLTSNADFDSNRYTGKIAVGVTYSIPKLNIKDQSLEITLFVI
jgi:phage baseplate assembly protein W